MRNLSFSVFLFFSFSSGSYPVLWEGRVSLDDLLFLPHLLQPLGFSVAEMRKGVRISSRLLPHVFQSFHGGHTKRKKKFLSVSHSVSGFLRYPQIHRSCYLSSSSSDLFPTSFLILRFPGGSVR